MYPQSSTLNMIQFQAPQLPIKLRQPCDSLSHKARLLEDRPQKLMRNNKQQMKYQCRQHCNALGSYGWVHRWTDGLDSTELVLQEHLAVLKKY